jgi:hypothetical protein
VSTRRFGPQSSLEAFAQAISSASDLDLAAWQERGLADLRRGGSLVVWCIAVLSAAVGFVCGASAWRAAWRSLGALPAYGHRSLMGNPIVLVTLAGALSLLLGVGLSFGLFQLLSRAAYALRREPAVRP